MTDVPANIPMIINVAYTVQELQVLTKLLDIAVKAGGLAVTNDVAVLHTKHLVAAEVATVAAKTPDEFTMRKQLKDNKAKVDAATDEQKDS